MTTTTKPLSAGDLRYSVSIWWVFKPGGFEANMPSIVASVRTHPAEHQ